MELGLGMDFVPVVDGQDAQVQLGIQGLYMFVVSARVHDMDVGAEDLRGTIHFQALDQTAQAISLETGCRVRDFVDAGDGTSVLQSSFFLPLLPAATPTLDGAMLTIRVEVGDHEGRHAIDERTVIARMPMSGSAAH